MNGNAPNPATPGRTPFADRLARACAILAAGFGIVALLGWIAGRPDVAAFGLHWIPMAPSTALLFVLCGIAILLNARPAPARAANTLGAAIGSFVLIAAALLFLLGAFGVQSPVEHLGLDIAGSIGAAPLGHMSPVTALCFTAVGLSWLLSLRASPDHPRLALAGLITACVVIAAGAVLTLAYALETPAFYSGSAIPPALPTTMGFVALGVALTAFASQRIWAPGDPIDAAGLRTARTLFLVLALVAAGILGAGYVYVKDQTTRFRAEVEAGLSAIGELKAGELERWRFERLGDAAVLFRNPVFAATAGRAIRSPRDADARQQIESWLRPIKEAYQYRRIDLIDAAGTARISIPAEAEPVPAFGHARAGVHPDQVTFVDFHRSSPEGPPRLALRIPVISDNEGGAPLAVVLLHIDPNRYLYPYLRRWPASSRSAETLLVRREGDEAVFLNELRLRPGTALTLRIPLSRTETPAVQAVLGHKGIVEGYDYGGVPVIADVRPIAGSPWFLVSRVDSGELFAPMRERLWQTMAALISLLIAAGASLGLTLRHQRVEHYKGRLRLAEALSASLARYRTLAQTAASAIVTADADGNVTGWNPAAEHMFGYGEAEIVGRPLTLLMPQRYRDRHLAGLSAVRAGARMRVAGTAIELHGLTKAGNEFPLELSLSGWQMPEGRFFTGILRDTTERKRAELALVRQKDLYATLSQTNQAIVHCTDRDELFRTICRVAVEHGRFRFAWIGLLDADSGRMRRVAQHGEDGGFFGRQGVSPDQVGAPGSLTGQVLRAGARLVSNDYLGDPLTAPWHEPAERAGLRAAAVLPVRRGDAAVGVIAVYAGEAGFFTDDLLATLDEMAGDVSFALDNLERDADRARAVEALRESEEKLRTIFEGALDGILVADAGNGRFLTANPAICSMLGYTAEEILRLSVTDIHPQPDLPRVMEEFERQRRGESHLAADIPVMRGDGSVFYADIKTARIRIGGKDGLLGMFRDITERKRSEESLRAAEEKFRGLVEQSIAGTYIIQHGKFIYVNPRFAEIFGYETADELIGRDVSSVVAEKDRDRVAEHVRQRTESGVERVSYEFTGVRKNGSMFEAGVHGARAAHLGRPAIIGLIQDISEKKRADEQIQRYVAQLKVAFMQTVGVATTLSEMRDPYTAGHERRVAEVAVAIGAELGFDDRRLEGLRVAGYLHDLGKITVPSEILAKPGKLSQMEFELIKEHPQASYNVLKDVEFPWPVADVALQHHERIDGSGYPQGLKGDAILFEARILAVADVVEAMASHRPYRPGLGIDKALAEIERGRGTAYDPAVTAACLKLFREKGYAIPA